jgi:hypothetical protein
MNTENASMNLDIDSLLDGTLDDLSDVPEFKPFAPGAHQVKLGWKVEAINNIPSIKLKLTHVETLELTNPEDTAPVTGDTTEVAFMLKKKDGTKNELAEGQWKLILASIKQGLGLDDTASNREVMTASEGLEVVAVTEIRKQKANTPEEKSYTSVKSVTTI